MLALLLASILAALLGCAGLVMPLRRHTRTAAVAWAAIGWLVLAVVATMALEAVVVVASLRLLGVPGHYRAAGIAGVVFASLAWLPATRRWNAPARLCWASSMFLAIAYLTITLEWTFASRIGTASTACGLLLWFFELFAAVLSCAYLWEICQALGTEHWRRRVIAGASPAVKDSDLPMISLHVPAHNEPPDMVIDTLRSLVRIDYPRYEVILIDDNTDDEALWRPVQQWCARHGVKFAHLENWPGYKSGALNYALRHLTDPRAELIGVVDSDYQIKPGFLRSCAAAFADPWIGFVQAPQDYRGWRQARYYRRLYYSYKYFFAISQPSRNEHDGAIFAGTMGLIRRVALDELGGWDEWCITEDAELSLRLLRAGWSGLHLDQSWGHGIMPLTFEALKGQRYRWCFGGIQILRMHWRSLMPGRMSKRNHLSAAQRWAYLGGGSSGTATCSDWSFSSSSSPVPSIWRPAAARRSASSPRSFSRPCRCFSRSGLCGRWRCSAAVPEPPGARRSAPSSSGNPPPSWWRGPQCLACSRGKRPSCAPRRPASARSGGRR